ncbi:MAG TPA: GntP family permease, partial [Flavilitoribacter sp.]|nr:GntP family permease [Flavilitoribacter sp.]
MIKHSGIGPSIEQAMEHFRLPYILVAWLIAAVMKTAQGSSTVAMITSSSIMFAIIGSGADLPYHPVYIFLAVGFGSMFVCWMNDSGFWVVTKMSGFTEKEGLQTWTLTTGVIGLVGLIQLLLFAQLIPMK